MRLSLYGDQGLRISGFSSTSGFNSNIMHFTPSGNIGIGTATPTSRLSIGNASQFQINNLGDIKKISGFDYSFPNSQPKKGQVLENASNGNLNWKYAPPVGSGVLLDSFSQSMIDNGWALKGKVNFDSYGQYLGIFSGSWVDTTIANNVGLGFPMDVNNIAWNGNEVIFLNKGRLYFVNPITGSQFVSARIKDFFPSFDTARSGICVVARGTFGVIISGGRNANTNTTYKDCIEYSKGSNIWFANNNMPLKLLGHSGIMTNNNDMYIYGGDTTYDGYGIHMSNKLFKYNWGLDNWTELAPNNTITIQEKGVVNANCNLNASVIYFSGGQKSSGFSTYELNNNTIYQYDVLSNTWSLGYNPVTTRSPYILTFDNNECYLIGTAAGHFQSSFAEEYLVRAPLPLTINLFTLISNPTGGMNYSNLNAISFWKNGSLYIASKNLISAAGITFKRYSPNTGQQPLFDISTGPRFYYLYQKQDMGF
jgi:hypothetical protein